VWPSRKRGVRMDGNEYWLEQCREENSRLKAEIKDLSDELRTLYRSIKQADEDRKWEEGE